MDHYQPTTIDYINTVFETADLTKIHGEPTMATLLTLQNKLKATTQSVQSMLGGAVDKKYIKTNRNSTSNNIALTILQILNRLFGNYGDVTAEELHNLRTQVENMSYDIREPVDNIFTDIEGLEDIAKLAKDPITKQQMINIVYLILQ
eukprot:15325758-Ditylum_brightwellii.AAC.1